MNMNTRQHAAQVPRPSSLTTFLRVKKEATHKETHLDGEVLKTFLYKDNVLTGIKIEGITEYPLYYALEAIC